MFSWRNSKKLWVIVVLIVAVGILIYVFAAIKSDNSKTDTIITQNDGEIAESGPLPKELSDINSLNRLYNDKKYSEILPLAKSLYENVSNPIDFRLAGLGYCVRATKELGGDSSECQAKADNLLSEASGGYKKFLLDSFNGAEEFQP